MIIGKSRSFYSSKGDVWIQINFSHVSNDLGSVVESVIVTREKLCDKKFKAKESFDPLVTSQGIRLGDSIDKILNVYGEPSVSIVVGKDKLFSVLSESLKLRRGCILRYLTNNPAELLCSEFYVNEEGLHSILVSRSE